VSKKLTLFYISKSNTMQENRNSNILTKEYHHIGVKLKSMHFELCVISNFCIYFIYVCVTVNVIFKVK